MLVLFETSAGYSLFKVNDEKRLSQTSADDIYETFFSNDDMAQKSLQMISFQPFADTADAVQAAVCTMEGTVSKRLKSFLKTQQHQQQPTKTKVSTSMAESLAVADKALAVSINETLSGKFKVVHDDKTHELFRGIRCYMDHLVQQGPNDDDDDNGGKKHHHDAQQKLSSDDLHAMQLGLSHSLGRYKLKFSADKVDTMVIQAVGLLDELDKEINTYAMRVKEWYGWHFPELQALVSDNAAYAKLVLACGLRPAFKDTDLSLILVDQDETVQAAVKEAAEISMGTEIATLDIINIQSLAEQVLSMTEYRAQLFEYLKNRMNAIAPNLTILVGELVGARLIAHAGSLMNLAKQPASTVQILGAEKALFRALKTKHDTPKYGLIYHASLIGQAAPKHKGKISRVLAAKASLAIRVDALTEDTSTTANGDNDDGSTFRVDTTVGFEGRAKVEARLRQLEGGDYHLAAKTTTSASKVVNAKTTKYDPTAAKTAAPVPPYRADREMQLETTTTTAEKEAEVDDNDEKEKKKKAKKEKKDKKKRKKSADEDNGHDEEEEESSSEDKKKKDKKNKKKKRKLEEEEVVVKDSDEAMAVSKGHSPKDKEVVDDDDEDDEEAKKVAKKAAKKAKKEKRKSKD